MNTFGNIFRITTFGESHGPAIGGVIDGMPAGIAIDLGEVQREMARRRPGQSDITTSRDESDKVEILSGIFEGVTTGTPIGFVIRNENQRSGDYEEIRTAFRPSHADYTYMAKYGVRDYRGGGRSSARETAARVAAGALAKQALAQAGIKVIAYTSQMGNIKMPATGIEITSEAIESNPVRCPDKDTAARMEELIRQVKSDGDTIGGIVSGIITGVPAGLGDPVFGKLHAMLGSAMLSINAAKGFDYGMGFNGVERRGSEMLDSFTAENGRVHTTTNNSGGIQGGISNGEEIHFRVAFKPVATLLQDVETIDENLRHTTLHANGRHDPCVLPRAVPVVEAMAAITILDAYLANQTVHLP